MRTKLLAWTGAATLMLAATTQVASAETANLGTIPVGQTEGYVFSHRPGSFTDTLNFNISVAGTGAADYFNFLVQMNNRSNIQNAYLVLTGPAGFSTYETALTSGSSYALQLLSGSYSATITGNATGRSGGAYEFDVTAPTPEPATMTLMFGGAAAASYMGRRRKRAAARQAAAA